jgi:septal ring-binding cell division protein DamX
MAVHEAPDQTGPRLDSSCPTCGAPAERGQLVCLECGSRIALAYRRPPSWRIPVAITVLVAALAVAGAVFALNAIGDDAKDEVAAVPLKPKKPAPASKRRAAAETPAAATTPEGLVQKGALYTWPKDLRAFTVVLLSAEDRATAMSFARSAAKSKAAKIGVIRASDFESLPKGFFVVFGGSYKTRARADLAAARLGVRYRGAFAQRVRR